MNKFLLLLNIVQFAVILNLTNPPEQKHVEVKVARLKAEINANASLVTKVKNVMETAKSFQAAYNNYYFFSTTTREDKTLTFGILGMVHWVGGDVLTPAAQPK